MDERPDILVVGLGPAGAAAARAAAAQGARVLAVERNALPGLPVQCAEFVPQMICADLPRVARDAVQPIHRMVTFVGDEGGDETPDFHGYMVDRAAFDQALVAEAQAAGVECRYAAPLQRLDADGAALLADGSILRPSVIIGADGPRSRVGAAIGCVNRALVETRQITVDLLQPHDATDIFLDAAFTGGYAWLFPKGNVANLGLGVIPAEKSRMKPLLDALHAQLVREGRVGARVLGHTGGAIPVGGICGLAGKLGDATVLLAGDAAGLTNPVTGAGIASAVQSGLAAGEAAARALQGDDDAAEDYADEITALFAPALNRALDRRTRLLDTYRAGATPGATDLRQGWIAYPQYWTPIETPQPQAARMMA